MEDRFFRLEDMERYVADAERRAAQGSDDEDGGLDLGSEGGEGEEDGEDEEDDELLMQGGQGRARIFTAPRHGTRLFILALPLRVVRCSEGACFVFRV